MLKRFMTAIPALVILAAVIYFHGYYLLVALWVVSVIAEYEMICAVKQSGIQPFSVLLYIAVLLGTPIYKFFGFTGVLYLFTAFVLAVCITGVFKKELAFKNIIYTIAIYVYPQLFYLFLIAIAGMEDKGQSQLLLILAFATSILTDTFAYFLGSAFGKHKLSPLISPKKSVEGAVAGVIGGMLAAFLAGLLFQKVFGMDINVINYPIAGFIMSILSQLGDLTASLIKREFGIKDYGKILPGHGGIMDRLDSVLFLAPVIFIYFTQFKF